MNKKIILLATIFFQCFLLANAQNTAKRERVKLSKEELKDKIKGGWAGQTIGVTLGFPFEFQYCGAYVPDSVQLPWYDGYLKKTMVEVPGLYDDIYVDLTFVDVFNRLGMDAPVDSFARAFAYAEFPLDQANQAARYNLLNGIDASKAGHWMNNPHADDIDYQIESDFAGLMTPGMPNAASRISDKIGHIMNYGDGWYGGVYVGAMYSLAFVSDDIRSVVREALNTIPAKSTFYQCIADVIKWHKENPDDWHQAWKNLEEKWGPTDLCPDGTFRPFNIDAKMNAAYVVLGLLYGNGDYGKTLDISTRAGQDADCNPSTAAGILGTMIGYDKIPAHWKMGLKEAEDIDFRFTNMSLNDVYDISFNHALEMIKRNGGTIKGNTVEIAVQKPKPVRYEKSFPGLYQVARNDFGVKIADTSEISFVGTGFVWRGGTRVIKPGTKDYTFVVDVYVDGKKIETAKLPTDNKTRRRDLCWNYGLSDKKHQVKIVVQNPHPDYELFSLDYTVYSNSPKIGLVSQNKSSKK